MFAIRHKASNTILDCRFARGGSYWNPTETNFKPDPRPRIFISLRAAKSFISQWTAGEHKQTYEYDPSGWGSERSIHSVKDVGRSRSDLEIIPLTITFGDPL